MNHYYSAVFCRLQAIPDRMVAFFSADRDLPDLGKPVFPDDLLPAPGLIAFATDQNDVIHLRTVFKSFKTVGQQRSPVQLHILFFYLAAHAASFTAGQHDSSRSCAHYFSPSFR